MQKIEIITSLPVVEHEFLARQAATENGYNCYSKPQKTPDEEHDGYRVYYFKWKGKTLSVTVRSKEVDSDKT